MAAFEKKIEFDLWKGKKIEQAINLLLHGVLHLAHT